MTLVVWLGSAAHVLLVGTDRRDAWLLALVACAVVTVTLCALVRVGRGFGPAGAVAGTATALAAMLALAFVPQPSAASAASGRIPARFSGDVDARVVSQRDQRLVSVVGRAGSADLRLDLVVDGNAVAESSLQLRFGSATCTGTVSALDADGATGTCRAGGVTHRIRISWSISGDSVSGRLDLRSGATPTSSA